MKRDKNILLIGDSNFLISHENHLNQQGVSKKISLGSLLEASSVERHNLKVRNISNMQKVLYVF